MELDNRDTYIPPVPRVEYMFTYSGGATIRM